MKVKTSITLSEDLLDAIDKRAADFKNRSDFIEAAIRAFLAQRIREERNAKDREILDRHADRLNQEAEDVLAFQVSV
jgi:metal-responsive CopG/Arc/MetJ family transcriptional regulator